MRDNTTRHTTPARLTDLPGDRVAALPPEAHAEWERQSDQDADDFWFLQRLTDGLYTDLRKSFKRLRAEQMGDPHKSSDAPRDAAFGKLLGLVERCQSDPAFLERFRHLVAKNDAEGRPPRPADTEAEEAQSPPSAPIGVGPPAGMTEQDAKAFVGEWLPNVDMMDVGGWVEHGLQNGTLWACPVCHFVSPTGHACPVCANAEEAIRCLFDISCVGEMLENAESQLAAYRQERAEALHGLFLDAFCAAEHLLFAAMYAAIRRPLEAGKAAAARRKGDTDADA